MKTPQSKLFRQFGGCVFAAVCAAGCAGSDLSQVGGNLLGQTGLISSTQASSLIRFGQGVADSQREFTAEEEYYLGRAVAANILGRYRSYNRSEVKAYLSKIALTLAFNSERPETFGGYRVQVLDSPEINAVSAPGGFIFVTTGFLRAVPDEDSLAAVLAHEVAHIVKGHGLSAISDSNLSAAFLLLGKETAAQSGGVTGQLTSVFGDSVSDVANTLLERGYSRSQEYEADQYAAELLSRAGYDPQALTTMLSSIESLETSAGGGWMSTHPAARDRKEEVSSVLADLTAAGEANRSIRAQRFSRVRKYF